MTEPLVWVPKATGTNAAATAAADPLDEPPGVRVRSRGLRVGPGTKSAYCDVTVLPITIAPAARNLFTIVASRFGLSAEENFSAMLGRKVRRVDDVFDRDRQAVQRPWRIAQRALFVGALG